MNVYILSINIIKFICCIKIVEYILLERELKKFISILQEILKNIILIETYLL